MYSSNKTAVGTDVCQSTTKCMSTVTNQIITAKSFDKCKVLDAGQKPQSRGATGAGYAYAMLHS